MLELDKAFDHLLRQGKKYDMYRYIAGILCLSQLTCQNNTNEQSIISSQHLLDLTAHLLNIDSNELKKSLTKRTMNVPNEEAIRLAIISNETIALSIKFI